MNDMLLMLLIAFYYIVIIHFYLKITVIIISFTWLLCDFQTAFYVMEFIMCSFQNNQNWSWNIFCNVLQSIWLVYFIWNTRRIIFRSMEILMNLEIKNFHAAITLVWNLELSLEKFAQFYLTKGGKEALIF